MAGKRGVGENTKKVAGQARKADAAAAKKAAKDREGEAAESAKWGEGSRDNSKKDAAAAKSAEAARKKAERAALEAEEMSNLKSAKAGNSKTAQKKNPNRELDLSQLEANDQPSSKKTTLNATGIDDALDALSLTNGANESLDRHPERRFKAAYNAFESRRLEEMKDDKTLRRQQKIEQIRKEFEKSPENPFNQVNVKYNTTTKEISNIKEQEKDKTESRLANNPSG